MVLGDKAAARDAGERRFAWETTLLEAKDLLDEGLLGAAEGDQMSVGGGGGAASLR